MRASSPAMRPASADFLAGCCASGHRAPSAGQHEFVLYAPGPIGLPAGRTPIPDARRGRRRGHLVGADALAAGHRRRRARRLLRTRLHGSAARQGAGRRDDSRSFLRRASRVVPPARRHPPAMADQADGSKARVDHHVSEFSRGEIIDRLRVSRRPGPRDRARESNGSSVSAARRMPTRACCTSDPSSIAGTCRISFARWRRWRARGPTSRWISSATTALSRTKIWSRSSPTSGLGGRVRWHRYVTDDQLLELYGRARAFAFLSEYEGLGMTPLEALAAGVPPVLYDTAGRAGIVRGCRALRSGGRWSRRRTGARAGALRRARPARRSCRRRRPTLAKYDWPRAARETLAVIESGRDRSELRTGCCRRTDSTDRTAVT